MIVTIAMSTMAGTYSTRRIKYLTLNEYIADESLIIFSFFIAGAQYIT